MEGGWNGPHDTERERSRAKGTAQERARECVLRVRAAGESRSAAMLHALDPNGVLMTQKNYRTTYEVFGTKL